jgi:hypothetical protein
MAVPRLVAGKTHHQAERRTTRFGLQHFLTVISANRLDVISRYKGQFGSPLQTRLFDAN